MADTGSHGKVVTICHQCSPASWRSAAHSLPQEVMWRILRQLNLPKDLFMGFVAGGYFRGNSCFLGKVKKQNGETEGKGKFAHAASWEEK